MKYEERREYVTDQLTKIKRGVQSIMSILLTTTTGSSTVIRWSPIVLFIQSCVIMHVSVIISAL